MPPPTSPFTGTITLTDVARRAESGDPGDDPASMRRGFARLLLGDAAPDDVTPGDEARPGDVDLGGAPARRYGPGDDAAPAAVLYCHGGGYVFGSPETHARLATALAAAAGAPVYALRYRLAPEHPWPAQRDDALAAARALRAAGCTRLALAGDSAGGHLALVATLHLAAADDAPDALALLSPNTDRTGLNRTRDANAARDPMVDPAFDGRLGGMAFADADLPLDHPDVSPALADLAGLPPTHLEVGDREVLLGDTTALHERALLAGVDVSLAVAAGAFHMWQAWTPWLPEAGDSLGRVGAFLRKHLGT